MGEDRYIDALTIVSFFSYSDFDLEGRDRTKKCELIVGGFEHLCEMSSKLDRHYEAARAITTKCEECMDDQTDMGNAVSPVPPPPNNVGSGRSNTDEFQTIT